MPLREYPIWMRQYTEVVYVATFLQWLLRLVELVPLPLLVSMECIRYAQAKFVEWDCGMHSLSKYVSAKVHRSSLVEQRTAAPSRRQPSMLPGFGQWTVSVRPSSASMSAKKRL